MFISIITVVYNGEKTIERTIKSVLAQNFEDYEYIIQDGQSSDKTIAIAQSYENLFNGRLHIYSERDKGIYDAMNKGIQKAKGDYIWLVNSDDYICDNALKQIHNYLELLNYREIVLSARMNVVDSNTLALKYISSIGNSKRYEEACKRLRMGISHPATIVHRNIYNRIGLYDDNFYISADIDFCLRCFEQKIEVQFSEIIVTNMTDGGISNRIPFKKNMHDCLLRADKHCSSLFEKCRFVVWFFIRLIVLKVRGGK